MSRGGKRGAKQLYLFPALSISIVALNAPTELAK